MSGADSSGLIARALGEDWYELGSGNLADALEGVLARLAAAEAELVAAREALQRIAELHGGYPDDYCRIARAALDEEAT